MTTPECVCGLENIQKGFVRTDCTVHVLNPVKYDNEFRYVRVNTPHRPDRTDDVAQWIRKTRDGYQEKTAEWYALDFLLDDYRLHADVGKPLSVEVHEGRHPDA